MKSIVLIGFMGSGKTSVGARLSELTGARFVDTDELIVKNEKKNINDIFANVGEEGFRRIETTTLSGLAGLSGNGLVISTGGGIVTRPCNIPLLKKAGRVVFLRVTAKTVVRRLAGDTSRPLLRGDDPQKKVHDLMEKRKDMYEAAADITIDCDELTVDVIANKVLQNCKE